MFKYIHKITTYQDDSRIHFRLNKRNRNCRFKNKVFYVNSEIILSKDGKIKSWYKNGVRHREDGPALIHPNGDKEWYLNGKRHREDGLPAIIRSNGDKEWYLNDKLHREGGKPATIESNGIREWWIHGKFIYACHTS